MTSDRSRWLILALVVLAQLMVVLDATIVNIALPTAQQALGFSNGSRQWIVTGYALAFGSLLPLGGRLGDVFGRRRALLVGFARLRRRLGVRRGRAELRVAAGGAGAPGSLRRAARPLRARPADDDLHRGARPQQGLRDLRRGRRQRRRGRPAARRRAHRVPLLALVPVREPLPGAPGRPWRDGAGAVPEADEQAQPRPAGRADRGRRPVPDRLRLRPRPDRRLGRGRDDRLPRRRRRAARSLRRDRAALPPAAAADAPAREPDAGGLLPRRPVRGCRHVRRLPLRDVLHAADARLQPADQRPRVPADDRHRDRRPRSG